MKTLLRGLLVGGVVACGGGTAVLAGDAPDPVVGTWTLNLAKSKFSPGPGPKSLTRTYAQTAQGTISTSTGVAADGSPISTHSTYRYDGKDYPYTGDPDLDTVSLKSVNASTVRFTLKKAGKVVGTGTRTISADGKVLTLVTKGTNAKGTPSHNVGVYDKQ